MGRAGRAGICRNSTITKTLATGTARRSFAAAAEVEDDDPFGDGPAAEAHAQQIDSPWQKWFPYDPKPVIPQYAPYIVHLQEGVEYKWCACGKSKTQPWTEPGPDSACECEKPGGLFKPMIYAPRTTGYKALCGCKHSPCKPLADMTGFWMWCDHNLMQGCAFMFVSCFGSSLMLSYVF